MTGPGAPERRFRVALTFDAEHADRPAANGVTERVLDALTDASVPASFFLQGRWVEAQPGLARRIAADGHLVGNHSHHHARMTILTGAGIARDVRAAERAILRATGLDPRPWFRAPFGAGSGSARLADRLAELGYLDVSWDVDGRDWSGIAQRSLARRVVEASATRGDGAVVLLHAWPSATAEALPAIARALRDAGAAFVRLDELERVPGRRSVRPLAGRSARPVGV